MTQPDELDTRIRSALADVIAEAPIAPDFDSLPERPAPSSTRPSRTLSSVVATAVAAAVMVVAVALNRSDDDSMVDTGGQSGQSLGNSGEAETTPTTTTQRSTIPPATNDYAAIQSAVKRRLPSFPIALEVTRNASSTSFGFRTEDGSSSFWLDVYRAGGFVADEMTPQPELETRNDARAWLGIDGPDLRSVYYLTDSGVGLWVASNAAPESGPSINALVAIAADLAEDPAIEDLVRTPHT